MLTLERNPTTAPAGTTRPSPTPPRTDIVAAPPQSRERPSVAAPLPAAAPAAPIDEPLLDARALRWLPLAVPLLGLSILCSMGIIWFML